MIGRMVLVCGMLACGQAAANDSIAELGTGGLILSRTDAISMDREDLFISMDKVTVDYVFRNNTDKSVESIVAFPMPDIEASPYNMPALPAYASDNFLGFEVSVDGKPVAPNLEQRAFAVGIDVTGDLVAAGVPVNPLTDATLQALEGLDDELAAQWTQRGLIFIDSYDDGSGWKNVRTPLWALKSTYWWRSIFPANGTTKVAHRYRPSLGGSVGLNFFYEGEFRDSYTDYKARYCMDEAFEKAIKKAAAEVPGGYPNLMEQRLDYVLTTGGNWSLGTIGDFRLTVDKGDPRNLISFCASNVRKTGPTTFEVREEQFYPAKDLEILILRRWEEEPATREVRPERKLEGASKVFSERARRGMPAGKP